MHLGGDGESAGARTQDQRLKRAMLYQLSYALKPHYQVSTFGELKIDANHRQSKLLPSLPIASNEETTTPGTLFLTPPHKVH